MTNARETPGQNKIFGKITDTVIKSTMYLMQPSVYIQSTGH